VVKEDQQEELLAGQELEVKEERVELLENLVLVREAQVELQADLAQEDKVVKEDQVDLQVFN
jgi:hypothetical protein